MKKLVLFSEYMRQFEREDSPRGDLARDMRDSPMPELLTYREYIRFLKAEKHACKEAVEAFKECHREYVRENKNSYDRLFLIKRELKCESLTADENGL